MKRPSGLRPILMTAPIPRPLESPRVNVSAPPKATTQSSSQYWSFERMLTFGSSVVQVIGGIGVVAVAATAAAPATVIGALAVTAEAVGGAATFSLGTAGMISAASARNPGAEAKVLADASRFVEPDKLAAKAADIALAQKGQLEEKYENIKAVTTLADISSSQGLAEEVKSAAETYDAAQRLIEQIYEHFHHGEAERKSETKSQGDTPSEESKTAKPGSENKYTSDH